jgi:hypothetical protein
MSKYSPVVQGMRSVLSALPEDISRRSWRTAAFRGQHQASVDACRAETAMREAIDFGAQDSLHIDRDR